MTSTTPHHLITIPPHIPLNHIISISLHCIDPDAYGNVIVQKDVMIMTLHVGEGANETPESVPMSATVPVQKAPTRKLPSVARRRRNKPLEGSNAPVSHSSTPVTKPADILAPHSIPPTTTLTAPPTQENIETFVIKSPISGIIESHNLRQIAHLTYHLKDPTSRKLLTIAPCPHTVVMQRHCVLCGDRVSASDTQNFMRMDHANQNILVQQDLAVNIGSKERERLFRQRKLSLVLDLDHTLFHATPEPRLNGFLNQYKYVHGKDCEDILQFFLDSQQAHAHFVRLRPHLAEFLEEASKLFELHIVTHGTKLYAKAMAKIIDPTKKYFANRIIAREDCEKEEIKVGAKCFTEMNWETGEYELTQSTTNKYMKKISHLFPQGVHTVLIIDDTVEVWREEYDNVLQIKPYHFFVGSKDVNNAAGTKLATAGGAQELRTQADYYNHINTLLTNDNDRELLIHLDVLKRLHQRFFHKLDALKREKSRELDISPDDVIISTDVMPHVNDLLSDVKQKTFAGCHFLFSRVFPLSQDPAEAPLWKDAIKFGAQCHKDFSNEITHVITNQRGTDKVKHALKTPGVFVVHVNWLFESKFRFEAQNEFGYFMYANDFGGRAAVLDQFPPRMTEYISRVQDNARDLVNDIHSFRKQLSKLKRFSQGDEHAFAQVTEEEKRPVVHSKDTADEVMRDIDSELASMKGSGEEEDFDALFDEAFDEAVNNDVSSDEDESMHEEDDYGDADDYE